MKQVNTPQGTMNIAGISRIAVAMIFDMFIALVVFSIILKILAKNNLINEAAVILLTLMMVLYPVLVHTGILPGLGKWSLGLHRFKYSEIEEFKGKGSLMTYEPLAAKIFSKRIILSISIFSLLYIVSVLLMGGIS